MNTASNHTLFIATDRAVHGHNGNNWIQAF
jgi:hypothetical protein